MAENENNRPEYYVSERDLEAKAPPALETGALKWIRENLFNSILNAILTLLGLALIVFTVTSLSRWVVQDANWFSVTANFRNLMLGRYNPDYEWRATLTLYFSVFVMGAAIAVWIRQIARAMLISIVVIVLTLQLAPRIIDATLDQSVWYAGAGNVEVVTGSATEVAFDQIGFIAAEGETVTITLADDVVASDGLCGEATTSASDTEDADAEGDTTFNRCIPDNEVMLSDIAGFQDNIANTLRNAALNRMDLIATLDEYEDLVAQQDEASANDGIPVVTATQYEEYTEALAEEDPGNPIIDVYNLNQIPVRVAVIEPETGEILAETVLTGPDDTFEVTLPATSWYVLEKVLEPADGADLTEGFALLEVVGITPLSKIETTNSLRFERRPDGLTISEQDAPTLEGQEDSVAFVDIIRNQYRGDRPLADYLRTYVSPFFTDIANYTTIMFIIGILGYVAAEVVRGSAGKEVAASLATNGLMSIPIVLWILINGVFLYSLLMWFIFIYVCIVAYMLFKLTKRDGYSQQIAIYGVVGYVIAVVALIVSGEFDLFRLLSILPLVIDDAAVPRFLVWLGIIIIMAAISSGRGAHIPGEKVETNLLPVGIVGVVLLAVAVIFTTIPGSIPLGSYTLQLPVTINTEWFLQPSNASNWGGLLLTVMLTVYGIIIAFPIGLALALGRRSDLPLIKYLCTAYIELVRGSPFITVLFFSQLFIPLINSDFSQVPGSYRAIAATIAFSAAYLAENVRGGLQSLPPGQTEAAKALGLSPWQTVSLITMPQALRAVIPALVGQFISLFKDTSLVAIIGLIDLLGFVNSMVVQAEFIGTRLEGLLFISILYFVVSYIMSYISRLLEASGSGSTRRM